ncbi:alpha/beta hydrolase [Apilactobacillus timberlakei]|uniref:alpha/beta hydrolase n=1 Tax=Apilactobacillus timberlakei TaxID=2008380 RepID=UPI001CDCBA01|nr:alpha/beta hydrolase [Apilactobacillus timberlakei]
MSLKKAAATIGMLSATVGVGVFTFSEYLFKLGMSRRDADPIPQNNQLKFAYEYYRYVDWFHAIPKDEWILNEEETGEKMVASYIPALNKTNKTVIMAHGVACNRETMANFIKMFHDLGFNVLAPDDRAHGDSDGKYVSYGWTDRVDYKRWINMVLYKVGLDTEILLYGISMGAGIVTMLSGEDLPSQVKSIIADCGYTNVGDEFNYLLRERFNLPAYPFEPLVSAINWHRVGYRLHNASCTNALKKNKRPILFIHGDKDIYVPTYMSYENYHASKGPKQLWIVSGAGHEESFWTNPINYKQKVQDFTDTYM